MSIHRHFWMGSIRTKKGLMAKRNENSASQRDSSTPSYSLLSILLGAAAGAAAMYLLDPDRGRRRRSSIRDKGISALNNVENLAEGTSELIKGRAEGYLAEAKNILSREESVPDEVLLQRVRSEMGRIVSKPRSIEITAQSGKVIVAGNILEDEVENLILCITAVRGVKEVENRLNVHKAPEVTADSEDSNHI
jgi:gas vesicle protein